MSDSNVTKSEFDQLLLACLEIAENFPDGVVYIGGIAVYLHSVNHVQTRAIAEFTHDADFYISLADMADLRDIEEVVANRRLSKHQLIKRGFEFDIYTERHSSLIVPYDQIFAHSVNFDRLRVACLEHLLTLKLEAFQDRRSSSKGKKDAKDIIRLGLIARAQNSKFDSKLCLGYLTDEHIALLNEIHKGPEFMTIALGNAKQAKTLRTQFKGALQDLI